MEFLKEIEEELVKYSDRILEQAISETDNGTYNQIREKLYNYQQEYSDRKMSMDNADEVDTGAETMIVIQVINDAITKLDSKMEQIRPFYSEPVPESNENVEVESDTDIVDEEDDETD